MKNLQNKIGLILNDDAPETPLKKRVGLLILFLILISSIEVILESVVSLDLKYHQLFIITDAALSIIFSIEYVLRIWTFKIDGATPTLKQRISHIFSFYMLIDFISILPFFVSIFMTSGFGFLRIVRILRLFRLFKFGRFMKSQNLVINAVKNKGKELALSMQVVVFLTVILSAILYHIENTAQPENFGDIVDAFVWSLSKFIGGVGGYGDFEPITFWGQVMATIVGLLGIALFAVPAGIIGAGFVEEIEAIKADEDLTEKNEILLNAFNFENKFDQIKQKKNIGLAHIKRKSLTFEDAIIRLFLTETEILEIANKGREIRIKNYKVQNEPTRLIESFIHNRSYGTLLNKNSKLTIVSTHSQDQPFLGHFTYALSEYLNANYLSNEITGPTHLNPKYRINLREQKAYESDEIIPAAIIKDFKQDLLNTIEENTLMINFVCSNAKNGSIHVLNGGKKGENEFIKSEGTFHDLDKLERFYKSVEKSLKDIDLTEEKLYSVLSKHKFYGNNSKKGLQWMILKKKKAQNIQIYVSTEVLGANPEYYYPIIKILGDNIKEHLI